ncbi:Gamma-glutamylcyclotransferase (modular protein) [Rhodovastum atsumiense]|nr:gamma-glutamylcyclotransferase [Rhodovastum atsumiense]CAH2604781.1 Gamma-glutamylcyclotransferase (modular protein) [Rhodovastum atsumiense]
MPADAPDPPRHRLTRDFLLGPGFAELIRRTSPNTHILTDAERTASLQAVLDARPEHGDGLWVFAYGSLIWNPTFHYRARRVASIAGWHRAFCLASRGGRGTPENPAMLLGLLSGGSCTGAVFRVAEDDLLHELDLLWRREMVTGAYIPHWIAVEAPDGKTFGQAIAFTMNPGSPAYAGELPEAEVVRRIATACGPIGSCAEYLFHTQDGLRDLGIIDPFIEQLADKVRAALDAASRTRTPETGDHNAD